MDRLAPGVAQMRIGVSGKNSKLSASESSQFGKTRAKDAARFAGETVRHLASPHRSPRSIPMPKSTPEVSHSSGHNSAAVTRRGKGGSNNDNNNRSIDGLAPMDCMLVASPPLRSCTKLNPTATVAPR